MGKAKAEGVRFGALDIFAGRAAVCTCKLFDEGKLVSCPR